MHCPKEFTPCRAMSCVTPLMSSTPSPGTRTPFATTRPTSTSSDLLPGEIEPCADPQHVSIGSLAEPTTFTDETMVHKTHGSASSGARGSTDPISQPDLVLWSDEPGGVLEPAQEERKARGKSVPIGPNAAEKATLELTHTSFRNWCSYCVRARAADDPHHRHPYKELEFPIIMADCCLVPDAPGKEFFTILDMLDIALGMMQQSVWRKRCRLRT